MCPLPEKAPVDEPDECLRTAASRALACKMSMKSKVYGHATYARLAPRTSSTFVLPFRKMNVGLQTAVRSGRG